MKLKKLSNLNKKYKMLIVLFILILWIIAILTVGVFKSFLLMPVVILFMAVIQAAIMDIRQTSRNTKNNK